MHVGALASAASWLPSSVMGIGLVATRFVLLAHWVTDVLAGLALGIVTERRLRPLTGYGERVFPLEESVPDKPA